MTDQQRRAVALVHDMARIRRWLDAAVARAVNEAAMALNSIRYWCDQHDADIEKHQAAHAQPHYCETCAALSVAVAQVRALLPAVPEPLERRADSGGEVDPMTDGTRVTPGGDDEDRDLPGDSQTGGSDSGN